jgi:hypothetical protein
MILLICVHFIPSYEYAIVGKPPISTPHITHLITGIGVVVIINCSVVTGDCSDIIGDCPDVIGDCSEVILLDEFVI